MDSCPSTVGSRATTEDALAWKQLSPLGDLLSSFMEAWPPSSPQARNKGLFRRCRAGGKCLISICAHCQRAAPTLNSPICDEIDGIAELSRLLWPPDHLGGIGGTIASKMEGLVGVYRDEPKVKAGRSWTCSGR